MTTPSDEERAKQITTAYEAITDVCNKLSDDPVYDASSLLYALSMHLGQLIAGLPVHLHGAAFDKVVKLVNEVINREVESGRAGKAQLLGDMEKYRPN